MPWQNVTPMEEINRFVILARSGRFTVTDLCEQFGISRKTGYKYLERYVCEGLAQSENGVGALHVSNRAGRPALTAIPRGYGGVAAHLPVSLATPS